MFKLILLLYFGLNAWLALRFWLLFRSHTFAAALGAALIMILSAAWIAGRYLGKNPFSETLTVLGALWIGFFFYVFLLTLGLDVFRLFNALFNFAPNLKASVNPSARFYGFAFVALGSLAIFAAGWLNARHPVARDLDLRGQAPLNLNIAVVSDIHLGRMVPTAHLERIAKLIRERKPDLVVFVGDVIDDYEGLDLEAIKGVLDSIQAPLGLVAVLGNHEYIAGSGERSAEILRSAGLEVLRDEIHSLDGRFVVVGRDDYSNQKRRPLSELMAEIPAAQSALPVILLDHQPHHLEEAEAAGALLQISGHTHNGQLWPLNHVIDRLYELPCGYKKKGETRFLTSVGAGTWGPPIRTNSRPEAVFISL